MIEFNPDGSLKLPGQVQKNLEDEKRKMRDERFLKVRKEVTSFKSPKECRLTITLSDKLIDIRFISNIIKEISQRTDTPIKLNQTDIKEFQIIIGSAFRRCSDCTSLIGRYREHLDGNISLDKGNCSYKEREFSYEDYFE